MVTSAEIHTHEWGWAIDRQVDTDRDAHTHTHWRKWF